MMHPCSSHCHPNAPLAIGMVTVIATAAADDEILDYRRMGCERRDHQASAVPLGRGSLGRGGGDRGFEGVGYD
jgi:hypothetical protein